MTTITQLKQAIIIAEKIESLQAQLNAIVGGNAAAPKKAGRPPKVALSALALDVEEAAAETKVKGKKRAKRVMSPEAIEKIREGQRKRWAAVAKAKKAK